MKDDNAIEVRNVTKSFKVYYDKGSELKEKALFWKRNRYEERWVLNGISFDVKKGEAVGLVGHNGCGKSTTLKLLTKIIYPDQGSIEMKGRVSSLIELGAGFHPDMSGRENIYTNAAIFGLKRKEIDDRLEDIIAFSELEEYIDNPVRTYSSGMYMRLAFSVAINVDADILLIDEILAVGDANFQAKCFNRLREIKAAGTTIVIVSHSLGQIEQICDRSFWIQDGLIQAEGAPRDVHPMYLNYMGEERQRIAKKEEERQKRIRENNDEKNKAKAKVKKKKEISDDKPNEKQEQTDRYGNREVEILSVKMLNGEGEEKIVFKTGEAIDIVVEYKKRKPVESVVCGVGIFRNDGIHCYGTNTLVDQIKNLELSERGSIIFRVNQNNLLDGEYVLQVGFHSEEGFYYDSMQKAMVFRCYSVYQDIGVSRLSHQWMIDGKIYDVDDSNAKKEKKHMDRRSEVMSQEQIDDRKENCEDSYFTDYSWYPNEGADGRISQWTREKEARLFVRNMNLDLDMSFTNGCPNPDFGVVIRLGQKEIAKYENCKQGDFTLSIPKEELPPDEWLEVVVRTDYVWCPSELQIGVDDRTLGICLSDLRWRYYSDSKLEQEGLYVQLEPLADHIDLESEERIRIKVTNASTGGQIFASEGMHPVVLAYHILDQDGKLLLRNGARTRLSRTLIPGDSEVVSLNYNLDELESGQYYWMSITLVQEGAVWFDIVDEENAVKIYIR